MLIADSPDPVNTLSGHLYPGEVDRFGRKLTVEEYLTLTMKLSVKAKKPLTIGEFGASDKTGAEQAKKDFTQMLAAIEKTGVPLAAMWVFNFSNQDNDWNVTATNGRACMLETIRAANERLAALRSSPQARFAFPGLGEVYS